MLVAFWFGVIAVLWAGFFVLEGFDFGVGMLAPFVGKTEEERGLALRSIGPVWDGNEVWLLTAGGATFAAFPEWYASVFSGFYLALALLLAGLIVRGIGIEYRSKAHTAEGRRWCDWAVFVGSALPALLLGVAFADFIRGVELDKNHVVTGGFFDLLTPYALVGGLASLSLFALHGALFLTLRIEGEDNPVAVATRGYVKFLLPAAATLVTVFLAWTGFERSSVVSDVVALVMFLTLFVIARSYTTGRNGRAFAGTSAVAGLVPVLAFAALWPDVLPATNGSALSLTAHQASSSHYTLVVMTIVALIMTPVVLAYQAWTYWVFRARVGLPSTETAEDGIANRAKHAAQALIGGSAGTPAQDHAP